MKRVYNNNNSNVNKTATPLSDTSDESLHPTFPNHSSAGSQSTSPSTGNNASSKGSIARAPTFRGRRFDVGPRYTPIKTIGSGAYGVVVSALDNETNEMVAIKQVSDAFQDLTDAKRVLREIKLLNHFHHENIINIHDILMPRQLHRFEDIYIVMELMETDLHRVICSKQILTDDHVQYFLYQILCTIKSLHSAGVYHRDLKPQNILVNSNCDLKVCDFGLARGIEQDEDSLTEYVVTRWYRAPEVLLAVPKYSEKIDIWAVGCIFAELLLRKPLFPGENYIDMLKKIIATFGTPSEEDVSFIKSKRGRNFCLSQPKSASVPFDYLFKDVNPSAVDLLRKLLEFNPSKRISVNDALQHPFLSSMFSSEDLLVEEEKFQFFEEGLNLTKPMLQELVFREISGYHDEARQILEVGEMEGRLFFPKNVVLVDEVEEKENELEGLMRSKRRKVTATYVD